VPLATYPEAQDGQPRFSEEKALPYFVFLQAGFTVPHLVTKVRGSLLHCLFTLAGSPKMKNLGGLFSVALSVASRHLGVTQRYALRSSDFPPVSATSAKTSDCPAHLLLL